MEQQSVKKFGVWGIHAIWTLTLRELCGFESEYPWS